MKSQTTRLLLVIGLFWYAQYVYLPFTTPFLLAQKVAADFVGLVVGIYGFLPVFTRIFVGVFSDRVGYYKPLIVTGSFAVGLASLVRVISPTGYGFLLANIISGFASSFWMCFILFHTKLLDKDRLKQGMGHVLMACNTGILLSFLSSALLYETKGMVFLCILSVITGLTAGAISLTLSEKVEKKEEKPPVRVLLQSVRSGRLWFFSFIAMIQQGILMAAPMSFTNEVANTLGASALEIGIMSMVVPTCIVLSCFMSSLTFFIKIGPGKLMTVAQLGMMLYCILVVSVNSVYYLIFVQILMGMTGGFVFSWASAEAINNIEPYRRSTAFSVFQSAFAVGMGIVPVMVGVIFHTAGSLVPAFYFQAALALMGAVCTAAYYIRKRQKKLRDI